MTFREKLADWISGGAVSHEIEQRIMAYNALSRMQGEWLIVLRSESKYRNAFFDIASQETPNANATVRRMARIAREALK